MTATLSPATYPAPRGRPTQPVISPATGEAIAEGPHAAAAPPHERARSLKRAAGEGPEGLEARQAARFITES